VYGPGGTTGDPWFPAGTVVTVASDPMWRSLTTTDFNNYDIIWIDGNTCGGTLSSDFGTALATQSAWGPAVRGRIVAISGDPDLHGGTTAMNFYANAIRWLSANGRNVDGGRTSLYFSWGCTQVTTPYSAGAPGSPETFAATLGAGITGNATNVCGTFTVTAAGTSSPLLVGVQPGFWGCPFHGAFTTIPGAYSALVVDGSLTTLMSRESPIACVP
jgi:hypothetical protein